MRFLQLSLFWMQRPSARNWYCEAGHSGYARIAFLVNWSPTYELHGTECVHGFAGRGPSRRRSHCYFQLRRDRRACCYRYLPQNVALLRWTGNPNSRRQRGRGCLLQALQRATWRMPPRARFWLRWSPVPLYPASKRILTL